MKPNFWKILMFVNASCIVIHVALGVPDVVGLFLNLCGAIIAHINYIKDKKNEQ